MPYDGKLIVKCTACGAWLHGVCESSSQKKQVFFTICKPVMHVDSPEVFCISSAKLMLTSQSISSSRREQQIEVHATQIRLHTSFTFTIRIETNSYKLRPCDTIFQTETVFKSSSTNISRLLVKGNVGLVDLFFTLWLVAPMFFLEDLISYSVKFSFSRPMLCFSVTSAMDITGALQKWSWVEWTSTKGGLVDTPCWIVDSFRINHSKEKVVY